LARYRSSRKLTIWKMSLGRSTPNASKKATNRLLGEDEDQRDDEAVDADRLGESQAQDVGDEDGPRRLRVTTERFHRLTEADAQADSRTDGADHREAGGEIGVHCPWFLLRSGPAAAGTFDRYAWAGAGAASGTAAAPESS